MARAKVGYIASLPLRWHRLSGILRNLRFRLARKGVVFGRQPKDFIRHFDTESVAPSVLYFGDSTLERISLEDQDRRPLEEMVAAKLSGKTQVACISHSAYHMGVFNAFVRALAKTRHRPRVIILPVNLRSFSPQWDLNPDWQFDAEIQRLEDFGVARTRPAAQTEKPKLSFAQFEATAVAYPCTQFTRIGEFLEVIRRRAQTAEQEQYRRRQIFVFHYMHPLSPDHPRLLLINSTLKHIAEVGAFAILYVTPINCQAGRELIGDHFLTAVLHQVDLVRGQVIEWERKGQAKFLDCSAIFGASMFFHKYDPTEHLNQTGRQMLADILARTVLELPFL